MADQRVRIDRSAEHANALAPQGRLSDQMFCRLICDCRTRAASAIRSRLGSSIRREECRLRRREGSRAIQDPALAANHPFA